MSMTSRNQSQILLTIISEWLIVFFLGFSSSNEIYFLLLFNFPTVLRTLWEFSFLSFLKCSSVFGAFSSAFGFFHSYYSLNFYPFIIIFDHRFFCKSWIISVTAIIFQYYINNILFSTYQLPHLKYISRLRLFIYCLLLGVNIIICCSKIIKYFN